jgi:UDP-N-acetylmuramoylalanine--D-glutamate ligase
MKLVQKTSLKNKLLETRKKSLDAIFSIEHRLEFFSKLNGKLWVNDSKSTDVEATAFSLENMDGPVLWIVGQTKNERNLDVIYDLVISKVEEIIYYGQHETNLKYKFGSKVKYTQISDIKNAVNMAMLNETQNLTVLFSPACSSFPTHENYKLRGDYFKSLI